jgi:hypothetical protein
VKNAEVNQEKYKKL